MRRRSRAGAKLTAARSPDPAGGSSGDRPGIVDFVLPHLKQVLTIQHELLSRLLDEQYEIPLNLAEAFEDAGNRFLDLSEMITERHLKDAGARREAD